MYSLYQPALKTGPRYTVIHMIKLNLALRYGAAVVAVAAAVFLVYFYLPQRSAAGKMEAAARAAGGLDSQLSSAHASITQLPGPAVITPGSAGATASYLQALATAGSVSASEATVLPKPTANRLRNETVRRYNEAAGDPAFIQAIQDGDAALARASAVLTYHTEVMRSLRNILEYEAAKDLSPDDQESLLASIEAAAGGIARTKSKLERLTYAGDQQFASMMSILGGLETARVTYQQALAAGRLKGDEYRAFLSAVQATQTQLLQNRQAFWEASKPGLEQELSHAHEALTPWRNTLNNL